MAVLQQNSYRHAACNKPGMGTTTLTHDRTDLGAMKAVVRRFVTEIFESGHVDGLDELVAPDFVSHTFNIRGADALAEATRRVHGALTEVEFDIHEVVAEGDLVAVRLTSTAEATGEFMGIADAAGRRYTIDEMHLFRLSNGRIIEHRHSHDALGITRQLGAKA